VPKEIYKIEAFEGGINQKADPRDIADNQLEEAFNVDVSNPGRITMTGDGTSPYVNINAKSKQVSPSEDSSSLLINNSNLTNGYGLFTFSHDYNMADTPSEVASDFICINDGAKIHIWDSCYDSVAGTDQWLLSKINLGESNFNGNGDEWIEKVKPIYYKADNGLRVCDGQFCSQDTGALTNDASFLSSDTSFTSDTITLLEGQYIKINNEIMQVVSSVTNGTNVSVKRAQFGTIASSHDDNSRIRTINLPKVLSHIKRPVLEKARLYTNETTYTNASANIEINTWKEDVQCLEPANNYAASGQSHGLVVYDGKVTGMATTGTTGGTPLDEMIVEPDAPEKVLFSIHESNSANDNVQDITGVEDGDVINGNNATTLIADSSINFPEEGFTVGKHVIVTGSTNYDGLAEIVAIGSTANKIKVAIGFVDGSQDSGFKVRLEENRIDENLQNKYIFGMSFVYDGGGSEKQESPVKAGYVHSGLIAHDASIGKTNSGWKTHNAAQDTLADLAIEDDDGSGYSTWILNDGTFFFHDSASAVNESTYLIYDGNSLADGDYKIAIDVAEVGQLRIYPPGENATSLGGTVGDGSGDSVFVTINTPGVYLFHAKKHTTSETDTFNFVCQGVNVSGDIRINSVQVFKETPVEMDANNAIDMRGFEGIPKMFSSFNMNTSSQYKWNERIIGYRIYMKQVDSATTTLSDEWLLALDVNLQSGEYINYANEAAEQYLHLGQNWKSDDTGVTDTFSDSFVCTEKLGGNSTGRSNMDTLRNIPLRTYESENGYKADTNTAAMYKTATIVDRKVFIGNLKIGEKTYPDRMIEAPVDRFDTFPDDGLHYIDIAVGDGDEIVKLESIGNKLIQFKKKHAYLIEVSSEGVDVLETWAHKGIKSAAQSILAGNGVVWVNDSGLYYYNGTDLKTITSDSFQSDSWQIGENPAKPTILGYDESSNKVIILTMNVESKNSGGYIYDIQNASLTECQNLFNSYPISLENAMIDANEDDNYDILDIINMQNEGSLNQDNADLILPGYIYGENIPIVPDEIFRSNMITTKDRKLLLATNTSTGPTHVGFTVWTNNARPLYNFNSSANSFLLQTKDIDFGNIARRKKVHSIYVSFKAQSFMSGVIVKYATNGSNNFNGEFSNTTYYSKTKGFDAYNAGTSSNEWITVKLKPENSINNIHSMQLQFSFANAGDLDNLEAISASGANTVTLASNASASDDNYNGMPIYFYHGPGHSYYGKITDYNGTTKVATISPVLSAAVDTTTTYDIGFIPKRFAINDIAIVYREKSVK